MPPMADSLDWSALQALFERYRSGDPQAARSLFTELARRLRGFFRLRVDSDEAATDLAQAAALRIHFARDRFDSSRSLKAWVFTIAERCLIDHYRQRSHASRHGSALSAAEEGGAAGSMDRAAGRPLELPAAGASAEAKLSLTQELSQALATLLPIDQTIVYLYGVEELSMAEIAAAVGMTEGAVKVRAHRSYQRLRALLSARAIALLVLLLRAGGVLATLVAWPRGLS